MHILMCAIFKYWWIKGMQNRMLWLKDDLDSRKLVVYRAVMFSFIALFVLFVFQPFGTSSDTESYKFLRLFGYGIVTFCALLLSGFIEIVLLKFKLSKLSRLIIIPITYILITALFNHGYFVVAVLGSWHWQNQLLFVGYIFCIGVFPLIFLLVVNRHVIDLTKPSTVSVDQEQLREVELKTITLKGDNKNDEINTAHHHILFIKSSDNYCEITILEGASTSRKLLRVSLSSLLKQLPENTIILRCHRSYAVNLQNIQHYSGNAGGLQLSLHTIDIKIPVSRSYVKVIKDALSLIPKTC
ncbi:MULTISPECIES: LytTR family DNA-binding domain-containing protein [Pseudoalteromonas]|uniref:LytTR family DNA-binding domain-containing protein n=2 Tax=Pseudoalteromonas TaxID=53246 RepID=A0ABU9TIN5_9GAMM|nr:MULTISPECIES: LytTR family DNA-binding domain-containing protein [unclassified Pseudoalteromonas]